MNISTWKINISTSFPIPVVTSTDLLDVITLITALAGPFNAASTVLVIVLVDAVYVGDINAGGVLLLL